MRDWQITWQFQEQQTRRPSYREGHVLWPGVAPLVDVPCPQGYLFSSSSLTPLQTMSAVSNKLIVVVDDSLIVRTILETCVGRAGFEVKTFQDGFAFFRWLRTPEARIPDLLFLDLVLPKMDGYDIARYLKANPLFQQTVIWFVSQKNGVLDRLKGYLVGARGYLTKPFRTQDILAAVTSAFGLTRPDDYEGEECSRASSPINQ